MEGKEEGGGDPLGTCTRAASLSTKQLFHLGSGAHMESFIKKTPVRQPPVFSLLQVPLTSASQIHFTSEITLKGYTWRRSSLVPSSSLLFKP